MRYTRPADAGGCLVHAEFDSDGNVIGEVTCVSNGCDGTCNVQSEQEGSIVHYWCTCD